MQIIRMGDYVPDRECLARFIREDKNSKLVTSIEIAFPDVLKHGRELIFIDKSMIEGGLEAPFRDGMTEVNANCILNGSGVLLILDWL